MSLPDLPLPTPGQRHWAEPLNESLEALNDRLGNFNDLLEEAHPEELSDSFIAQQIATPSSQTATQLSATFARGVSVSAFGAVGDGVTDDTTAINEAIATGLDVFFPAGVYLISSALTVSSKQRLSGEGSKNGVTITAAAGWDAVAHPTVIAMTGYHPAIEHIQVDARGVTDVDGVRISANYEPFLFDVKVLGGKVGVNLLSGLESRMEHVSVNGSAESGFYIQNVPDAFLLNCSADGCQFGFRGLGGSMTFIHCHAIKSVEHGFYLVSPSSSQFYGCHADTNGKNGFHVTNASNAHFTDCWSFKNGAGLVGSSYNWLFSNVVGSSVKGGGSNNEANVVNSFFFTGTNRISLIGATADTKDANTRSGIDFIGCTGILSAKGMSSEVWLPAPRLQPFGYGSPVLRNADTAVRWSAWLLDAASVEGLAATIDETQVHSWNTWHVDLLWANDSGGGAGNVRWRLDSESVTAGGTLGSLTSGTAVTVTAGAARVLMKTRLVSDAAVPTGDLRGINLLRLGTDSEDTLANDVMVVGILLTRAS